MQKSETKFNIVKVTNGAKLTGVVQVGPKSRSVPKETNLCNEVGNSFNFAVTGVFLFKKQDVEVFCVDHFHFMDICHDEMASLL